MSFDGAVKKKSALAGALPDGLRPSTSTKWIDYMLAQILAGVKGFGTTAEKVRRIVDQPDLTSQHRGAQRFTPQPCRTTIPRTARIVKS